MNFHNSTASLFVPDGESPDAALRRVTHLGVGAHSDDLEFMAYHGIEACFRSPGQWFGGVTCTNGAGSARSGPYAGMTGDEMCAVRRKEQDHAAVLGEYAAMIQLDYPSSGLNDPANPGPAGDLEAILRATRPEVVYTHNLADKHATHIGVAAHLLKALRTLPVGERPAKVLGCEVWRGLDWMLDDEKTILDVSRRPHLSAALGGIFDSQIGGGKRYDLAVQGRRLANATFLESHLVDAAEQVWFAMDLTPLVEDENLDPADFAAGFIQRFEASVRGGLNRFF